MAILSFSNAMSLLANAVKVLDQHDKWVQTNSPNFISLRDTITQAAAGDFTQAQASALASFQSSLLGPLTESQIQSFLQPFLDDVTLAIDGVAQGFAAQLEEIRDYMETNSQSVQTRTMSFGSISAGGSNVGNGTVYQLVVDRHNNALQAAIAEGALLECTKDQASGARRNNEVFTYEGDAARVGVTDGSGLRVEIISSYDSQNVLKNPRFTSFNGTTPTAGTPTTATATSSFANWTLSAAASFKADIDLRTRASTGQTNHKSLLFAANGNFYQALDDTGQSYNREIPYLLAALVYKPASADGTFTLAWGSKSQAFTVGSSPLNTDDAWQWVAVDRDQDLFYDNWKQDSARVTVTLASNTTFDIQVQEVVFVPGRLVNGAWWWILGKDTPWVLGDTHTQTIGQSADGINQRWLSSRSGVSNRLGYGFSLLSSGTPTVADA